MKKNLYKYLAGNDYPGRGIVLGKSPDGQKAFVAYWIMGRSANSRNRVFEPIDGGIRTVAADPAKLEDPHLIIYNAVLTLRETTVVTNGDQTDTIARFMNGNLFPGYSFEAALATRTVFGVTFEQGRQDLDISNETMLQNVVTENKVISDEQRRDLIISLIVLKYTQSNSVCYVQDGQTIGVGAGQQSRVHCTRLAGQKADNWQLRHMPKVLDLPFRADIAKPNRDNAIDVYIGDTPEDVIGDDVWAETFTEQPAPLTVEEKRAWLDAVTGVSLGSDAFFPFGDNIERARRSGVTAIVQPGGSIRDAQVIDTCNKYGIAMAFCGIRLFHH